MDICVMGVDPGLQATGYGVVRCSGARLSLVEAGVVKTDSRQPLAQRLAAIYAGVHTVLAALAPDVIVVEDLFTSYSHPQTAVLMGHARGAILLSAGSKGLPVEVYTASMVKRALTGSGRAGKAQVARMVCTLLTLGVTEAPDHVTDALALALCHHNVLRHGPGAGAAMARPRR